MKTTIKIKRLEHFDESLGLPEYASSGSSGFDLKASFSNRSGVVLTAGETILVPTGLVFESPSYIFNDSIFEIQVRPRSGLTLKTNLRVHLGTVDNDYRGECGIIVTNIGTTNVKIEHGMKLAQAVLCPVFQAEFEVVSEVKNTERGSKAFGSSGVF